MFDRPSFFDNASGSSQLQCIGLAGQSMTASLALAARFPHREPALAWPWVNIEALTSLPFPHEESDMVNVVLLVRLEAKPGKEQEVAKLLENGLQMVEEEPATVAWFAVRFGVTTFGIFDAFPDDAGRQAHLAGRVAAALKENDYLFETTPLLETADVLAAKLPG